MGMTKTKAVKAAMKGLGPASARLDLAALRHDRQGYQARQLGAAEASDWHYGISEVMQKDSEKLQMIERLLSFGDVYSAAHVADRIFDKTVVPKSARKLLGIK